MALRCFVMLLTHVQLDTEIVGFDAQKCAKKIVTNRRYLCCAVVFNHIAPPWSEVIAREFAYLLFANLNTTDLEAEGRAYFFKSAKVKRNIYHYKLQISLRPGQIKSFKKSYRLLVDVANSTVRGPSESRFDAGASTTRSSVKSETATSS